MWIFTILFYVMACTLAATIAPSNLVVVKEKESLKKPAHVAILKQIHQVQDDGSYTFGYENSDGSFRVENKDKSGYITGKYGYVDDKGHLQILEYVAGKDRSGKSVGFKSSGANLPLNPSIIRTVSSPEQKALDYQYSSVDEDEDGIPDLAPTLYAHPKIQIFQEPKNPVIHVELVPQQYAIEEKSSASQSTEIKEYPVPTTVSNTKIDQYAERLLQLTKLKSTVRPIVNPTQKAVKVIKPNRLSTSYGARIRN